MKQETLSLKTHRRGFIGSIAASAAAAGMAALAPIQSAAESLPVNENTTNITPDEWFNKVKGTHRIVFDATHPAEIYQFAWPRVFLLTNQATGSSAADCGVVVVLRHSAIGYAMQDSMWEKYKLGELFKVNDPATKAPATRNPFANPKKGDFKVPGFGEVSIGINELQADGVMFCVCDAALTVYSAGVAASMNIDAAEVKKEWTAAILKDIMIVPSGVWAVGRAQEHKCAYCFVGA